MSFQSSAGISGWDLPHLKIGARLPGLSKMAALASKCVGKWGAAAQGWTWSAGGPGDRMQLVRQGSWRSGVFGVVVGSWRLGAISQSGVPVIGRSQLVWGSRRQGAVS